MKRTTRLFACLTASAVLLSACGNDDQPGKINDTQEKQKQKESKGSSKDKSSKESKSNDKKSNSPHSKTEKDKKKKDSPEQKIREENNKKNERVENNEKNLPDKYKDENAQLMLKDIGYVSVANDGDKKEDITDYLSYNHIEYPDYPAEKEIYDKFEKNFKAAYPKVKEVVNEKDATKQSEKRKEVINDYFYRNEENFDYVYNFAQNDWKPDYETLDITEANEENTYIWQMTFRDKNDKKVASLVGDYYDYVDAVDIIEGGLTNQGAMNAYDYSIEDYEKGGKS